MKKLLIAAALIAAVSCIEQEEMATVSFGVGGISEHPMTKTYVEDVQSVIASRLPDVISLDLTRKKSGKHYSVMTGETITLPVGEYTVTATIAPTSLTSFPRLGMNAASTPYMSVNEQVTIVSGATTYTLSPSVDCFAIAALDDCSQYTYKHQSATGSVTGDGIKLCFFQWDNDYELIVTAKPVDYDAKDDAKFTFGGTGVRTANGKFYVLHPDTVTTEEGGFIFGSGNWTEGQL